MKLYLFTEARFEVDLNNNIYSIDGNFNTELWKRYLKSFSKLIVVARINHKNEIIENNNRLASYENVEFIKLPHYIGLLQFLKKRKEIRRILSSIISMGNAYICRIPGLIGTEASHFLIKNKIPYGIEVVGDPWDVFSKGSINHPLRLVLRIKGYLDLKRIAKHANASLYVTESFLQKRYPNTNGIYTVWASDVNIASTSYSKNYTFNPNTTINIISIGSLEQMYKSPDVVVKSLSILRKKNVKFQFTWLGDGVFREKLIKMVKDYQLEDCVSFIGNVSKEKVNEYLITSHIFVLASKTEGLPRAMIEAMSLGLPCIGTKVGGIPELIDNEFLVKKNCPEEIANKIIQLIEDSITYNNQSLTNLDKSKKYLNTALDKKRTDFYNNLIIISQNESTTFS